MKNKGGIVHYFYAKPDDRGHGCCTLDKLPSNDEEFNQLGKEIKERHKFDEVVICSWSAYV